MKIACPSCSAKYSIADEKVQNRLAKIRCRKCGTTIVIDGKASPPTVTAAGSSVHPQATAISQAPAASVGPSGSSYTVDIAENDQRTMSVGEIVDAYNSGAVTADTYVWQEGMADWAPLADVAEINDALHAAAANASNPPADASHAPVAAAAVGPMFPAAQQSAEPLRAASRADARADLFGGIDMAGSEQDASLARGGSEAGLVTANTGARNESSVLFSLSALTADEPGATQKSTATEDSGLIDLAALTAKAEAVDASQSMDLGSAPLASPLGMPLGGAPLTGGTTAPLGADTHPPPASSKNGLFIGGGIAVAAVVAGLVFLLKEEPPPAPAVVPTATVIVTAIAPAPTVDPEEEKKKAEEDDEKQAEEDDKDKVAKAPVRRKYTAPTPKKSSPSPKSGDSKAASGSKETAKPAAPAPKKKSSCNCPKGDLMCAMKCSTK